MASLYGTEIADFHCLEQQKGIAVFSSRNVANRRRSGLDNENAYVIIEERRY